MSIRYYDYLIFLVLNGLRTCKDYALVPLAVCSVVLSHCTAEDAVRMSPAQENIIPGTVLAAVTIQDASEALARWNKSVARQLGSASELLSREFQKNRDRISTRLRADVGVSLEELQELQLGQISLACVKIPDQPVSVVLLADFRQHDLMRGIVDRFDRALLSSQFKLLESPSEFSALRVYERERPFRQLAACVHRQTLCLSTNPAVVRMMLQGWDSGTAAGFATPAWQAMVRNCDAADCRSAITWYLDPMGLLTEATYDQEPRGSGSLPERVLGLLPRLGLDRLQAVGGTLNFDVEDKATVARVQVVLKQPTSGMLDLVRLKSGNLVPPQHVVAGSSAWVATHWDIPRFFQGGNQVLGILEGEGAFNEYFRRFSLLKGGPTFKENLLDQMTGRLVYSVLKSAGEQQHWILDLQMRDPKDTVARLSDGNEPEQIEPLADGLADQHTISIYKQRHFGSDVYLTVHGDSLLMSDSPVALQLRVAQSRKTPSASERRQPIADLFPEASLLRAFHRTDPVFRNVYEALRANSALQESWGIDASVLLNFDQLQPVPGPTAVWAVENDAGIQLNYVSLYGDRDSVRQPQDSQNPATSGESAQ